jgi:hypothetical protein
MSARLPGLQRRFQDCVLQPGGTAAGLVTGDGRADAATRLGVYADAYRLRLLEVLGNDYPALRQLAGAGEFERIGRAYLEASPSLTPSVRWFGRHLPEFLRSAVPEHPAYADLALFEWKQGEAFDGPDAGSLPLEAMAAVPPESWPEMRLLLHPTLRRLDLRWNAPALFQAHEMQQPLPVPEAAGGAVPWLIWRDAALDVRWRSLGEDEAAALDAAAAGSAFGEICERLCEWVEAEQVALHAAGLLKRWLVDGLVVELEGVG